MTTPAYFTDLGRQTLFAPRSAAAQLLTLRLPSQWLWMALALMTILNAIVYSLSLHLSPAGGGEALALIPPAFQSPVLFAVFLGVGLVVTILSLTWTGRAMGGAARTADILVLITWLQVLRLIVQVAMLLLIAALPALAGPAVIVASFWGLVILVAFLNVAHQFDSVGKSIVLFLLAMVVMVLGLTLILSLFGTVLVGGMHV